MDIVPCFVEFVSGDRSKCISAHEKVLPKQSGLVTGINPKTFIGYRKLELVATNRLGYSVKFPFNKLLPVLVLVFIRIFIDFF